MYTNLRGFAHNPPKKSKPLSTAILLVTRLSSFINNISCHFKCSVSDPKYQGPAYLTFCKILLRTFNPGPHLPNQSQCTWIFWFKMFKSYWARNQLGGQKLIQQFSLKTDSVSNILPHIFLIDQIIYTRAASVWRICDQAKQAAILSRYFLKLSKRPTQYCLFDDYKRCVTSNLSIISPKIVLLAVENIQKK